MRGLSLAEVICIAVLIAFFVGVVIGFWASRIMS